MSDPAASERNEIREHAELHAPSVEQRVEQRAELNTSTASFDLIDPRSMAVRQLLVGTMLVVVGVLVTAATYSTAHLAGDRYLLAFGPLVIGAIAMVRGFIGLVRP